MNVSLLLEGHNVAYQCKGCVWVWSKSVN